MNIREVSPGLSDWARFATGLANACEIAPKTDKHAFANIKQLIDSGVMRWFAVYDGEEVLGDFTGQMTTDEDGERVMNIPFLFGKDMARWQHLVMEFYDQYAAYNCCKRIRWVTYKPHMARFYERLDIFKGWQRMHVFEKELN